MNSTIDNPLSVGKGPSYVVIKGKNENNFHIAISCSANDFYNNVTNTCEQCPTAQKSFGGQ